MSQKEAERNGRNKSLIPAGRKEAGSNGSSKNDIGGAVAKLKPYGHAFLWAAVTCIVTFGLFFISLVPPQVDLKVGEVSAAVSYTHLDVYKRQLWIRVQPGSIQG